MIKSNYTLKVIELGLKHGKQEASKLSKISNKIRNKLHEFTSKNEIPKIFCYENTKKPKENFYRLTLPREMNQNKLLIAQAIKDYTRINNFFNKYILSPLILVSGSSLAFGIYNVNSVFIIASLFTGLYSLVKANKLVGYHNIIVDSIYLKSCGKVIIINTLTRSFEVNIIKVRKMRLTEFFFF